MAAMRFLAAMLWCAALLSAGGMGCERDDPARPVTIFAAASTAEALTKVMEAKPDPPGAVISAGGSSVLATQIIQGAPADLFLCANPQWADEVAKHRPVIARTDLLRNRLVVVVPRDSTLVIDEPADLAQPGIQRLALGDPAAVPVGIYAKKALEAWGILSDVEPRIVIASDAPHALMLVETGAADAGIVYATDAAASRKIRVVHEVSAGLVGPIVYPLLLLNGDPNAHELYNWLQSSQATAIFEHHGFMQP